MHFANITRWPVLAVFALAGFATVIFAFVTVNLFHYAMASADFIRRFGWDAVLNGALWQVAELALSGAAALSCWLVFKIAEHDLTRRYADWAARDQGTRSRE